MAMGNFDKDDDAPMAEINTTPLVDVMLVLMVVFLVTAPMLTHAIKMKLPTETASEIKEKDPITISINAKGDYYWGDILVTKENIEKKMQIEAKRDKKQPLHVRADSKVAYEKVSYILAVAQRSGLNNIGFVTEPKE